MGQTKAQAPGESGGVPARCVVRDALSASHVPVLSPALSGRRLGQVWRSTLVKPSLRVFTTFSGEALGLERWGDRKFSILAADWAHPLAKDGEKGPCAQPRVRLCSSLSLATTHESRSLSSYDVSLVGTLGLERLETAWREGEVPVNKRGIYHEEVRFGP